MAYTLFLLTTAKALKPKAFHSSICQRFLAFTSKATPRRDAFAELKGSVNLWSVAFRNRKARRTILLHSSLINSRTPHGVFEEIGQLAGL